MFGNPRKIKKIIFFQKFNIFPSNFPLLRTFYNMKVFQNAVYNIVKASMYFTSSTLMYLFTCVVKVVITSR